jgi:hypothetical protein
VLVTAAGLLATGIPEDFEGPTLVQFGTGHGLDASNAAALVLLLLGIGGLFWGGWRNVGRISMSVHEHTAAMASFSVALAVGVLLLALSGTSTAVTLWAPGTLLVIVALLGLSVSLR